MGKKDAVKGPLPQRAADAREAFREVVYGFGVPELAQLMGLRPGTLYNKADASDETHHQPTLRDVVLATRLTGDFGILDALEREFGRVAVDVGWLGEKSDAALMELLLRFGSETGEFHQAIADALAKKRFDRGSLNVVRAEAYDAVAALMTLLQRLEGLLDE